MHVRAVKRYCGPGGLGSAFQPANWRLMQWTFATVEFTEFSTYNQLFHKSCACLTLECIVILMSDEKFGDLTYTSKIFHSLGHIASQRHDR